MSARASNICVKTSANAALRRAWRLPVLIAAFSAADCSVISHKAKSSLGRQPTAAEDAQFWVEPSDLARRDLFHGVGGDKHAPDPSATYRFVSKKSGTSPGYTVLDPKGVEWSVKLGPEGQAEVTVSRLLWAIGYHQPPVYYLAGWTLAGGPTPGQQSAGRFRPDLAAWKEAGPWSWYRNPFVETQPFRGLIVFMRIVNNWDLLNRNNMVYELADTRGGDRRLHVVKDLGASFGKTQLFPHQGSKNVLEEFERQDFIKKVEAGEVSFDDVGRRHRGLYESISPSDVRWACERLSRLSPKQWTEAFRVGGYREQESERFIRKIQEKIRRGLALPDTARALSLWDRGGERQVPNARP